MNRNKEGEIESLRVLCLSRYRKSHRDSASYGTSRVSNRNTSRHYVVSLCSKHRYHNLPEIKLDCCSVLLHLTKTQDESHDAELVCNTHICTMETHSKQNLSNRDLTSKNRHRFLPNASHSARLANHRHKEAS